VHIANSVAVLAEVESTDFEDAPAIQAVAWEITGLKREQVLEVAGGARAAVEEIKQLFDLPGLH